MRQNLMYGSMVRLFNGSIGQLCSYDRVYSHDGSTKHHPMRRDIRGKTYYLVMFANYSTSYIGKSNLEIMTPKDALGLIPACETGNSIPSESRPKFTLGQEVIFQPRSSCDRIFYLKQLRKEETKLSARELVTFLKEAQITGVSIAGIEPCYAIPTHMISSQCYLVKGSSWSGLNWRYKLLIKGVSEERAVCIIPKVWVGENSLKLKCKV